MRLRVADATQINLAGRIYRAGEELDVADADRSARVWLARGWATQLDAPAASQSEPATPEGGDKPAADEQPEPAPAAAATAEAASTGDVSQSEPLTDEELETMSRDDLREEAGRLGISKSGSKADLAERIRAAR